MTDTHCLKRICLTLGAIDGVSCDFTKNTSSGKLVAIIGYANTNQAFTVVFLFIRLSYLKSSKGGE